MSSLGTAPRVFSTSSATSAEPVPRDFPHLLVGPWLQHPFSLKVFFFLEMVDENDIALCQGECLYKNQGFSAAWRPRRLQGTYNILQCWNLKTRHGSFNNSMSKCCIHSICSLHSHDWYLSSPAMGNVATKRRRKSLHISNLGNTVEHGFWWVFHLHGGIVVHLFFWCSHTSQYVSLLSLLQSNSSVWKISSVFRFSIWTLERLEDERLSQESSSDQDACGSQTL